MNPLTRQLLEHYAPGLLETVAVVASAQRRERERDREDLGAALRGDRPRAAPVAGPDGVTIEAEVIGPDGQHLGTTTVTISGG